MHWGHLLRSWGRSLFQNLMCTSQQANLLLSMVSSPLAFPWDAMEPWPEVCACSLSEVSHCGQVQVANIISTGFQSWYKTNCGLFVCSCKTGYCLLVSKPWHRPGCSWTHEGFSCLCLSGTSIIGIFHHSWLHYDSWADFWVQHQLSQEKPSWHWGQNRQGERIKSWGNMPSTSVHPHVTRVTLRGADQLLREA